MIERYSPLIPQLEKAATEGDLPTIISIKNTFGLCLRTNKHQALANAAFHGHLEIVQWLHNEGATDTSLALHMAVSNGHLSILQWLYERADCLDNSGLMITAIGKGHVHVMEWFCEKGEKIRHMDLSINHAAKMGHVEMVRWLREKGGDINHISKTPGDYISPAAFSTMQDYLTEQRTLKMNALVATAIDDAQREQKILVPQQPPAYPGIFLMSAYGDMTTAVFSGNLEKVKSLYKDGVPFDENCAHYACMRGHLHILQWMYENGLNLERNGQSLFWRAAEQGKLDIMQWLHSKGIEIHFNCHSAAYQALRYNHMHIMKWIIENSPADDPPPWHMVKEYYDRRDHLKKTMEDLVNTTINDTLHKPGLAHRALRKLGL